MCGIIAIIGENNKLFTDAFNALKSLEYRGYDSFGFSALIKDKIKTNKKIGAISEANIKTFSELEESNIILGHTRWATHGKVSVENSHPHVSNNENISIVHNGVITNFEALKQENPHWVLHSETDTEIASNLIADTLEENNQNLEKSLSIVLKKLEGEFAITGIVANQPNTMFAIKRKSPLTVGFFNNGIALSSDSSAFALIADNMETMDLEDESILICSNKSNIRIFELKNNEILEKPLVLTKENFTKSIDTLDGYDHYMIKEIHESASATTNIKPNIYHKNNENLISDLTNLNINITGSGSAFYVALIGQYLFNDIAGINVNAYPSDEFLEIKKTTEKDIIIAISQSGETFDTLEVLREAKKNKSKILSINNVEKSTMSKLSDYFIFQNSGKEICVLSTKSIISQVSALFLLATESAKNNKNISQEYYIELKSKYDTLPSLIESTIKNKTDHIKNTAYKNCNIDHWFFIGRGIQYPIALEGALKFKEVSYLHAEGMPAGFFKHGTISLIDENFYTVAFIPSHIHDKRLYQSTMDNVYEIKARGGKIIGIGCKLEQPSTYNLFYDYIEFEDMGKNLNTISNLIVGQLFAYFCGLALGKNIDRPRGLAKSVTVR